MESKGIRNIRKSEDKEKGRGKTEEKERKKKVFIYLFICAIFDDCVSISDSIGTGVSCFPSVPSGKFLESTRISRGHAVA
jgi:hypothetical protein